MYESADPGGRLLGVVGLRPLGHWDFGFEYHWGHGWICHSTRLISLEEYIAFSNTDLSS